MKRIMMIALVICMLALAGAAGAQTWVSNSGSDSNPCTLSSPCRTFQRAVSVTPAYGQLSVVNAGDYGPVVLNQSIRIDGGGLGSITVIGSSTYAAVEVNAPAGSVVQLHNLSIHGLFGAPRAIHSQGSGGLDIDNVQVTGFAGNCIETDQVLGPIDLVIKDTTVENCSGSGIHLLGATSYPSSVEIINSHVRFANGGLQAAYVGTLTVFNSTFSSPGPPSASTTTAGIAVESSTLLLDNCQITGFGDGVAAYEGNIQVSRSSFIDNWTALNATQGGTIVSNENNSFVGNHSNGSFTSKVALQ